jgi:hypothetical protein
MIEADSKLNHNRNPYRLSKKRPQVLAQGPEEPVAGYGSPIGFSYNLTVTVFTSV